MARFVVLLVFLGLLGVAFTFKGFKKLPISNEKFDIQKAEEAHKKKLILTGKLKEEVKQTEVSEEDLAKALIAKGKALYSDSGCIECHGAEGLGDRSQEAPMIAGQHDWYIEMQLANFKSGERKNEAMMPYLENLGPEEFEALGKYISGLEWSAR